MKIHEYNEMMSYLTRPGMAQGGVIGKGGMFQGQDMGYRTGFSNYKNTLLTPAVAKNANIDIFSSNISTISEYFVSLPGNLLN